MLKKSPRFSRDEDVKILSQETMYEGVFKIITYHLFHRLFNGEWGKPITREVFARRDAAAILLFDPIENKVILIEQFRIGALKDPRSPWLLEIVAGVLGENEPPEEAIFREVKEETGLTLTDYLPITTFFSTPGACSELVSLFCGKVDARDAKGIHGLLEEGEDIAVHAVSLQDAYEALNSGIINNSFTIIALQWLQLNEDKVRKHFAH